MKTNVKAGGSMNHNETMVGQAKGLAVRTNVKAGAWANHNEPWSASPSSYNHNETVVRKTRLPR